MRKTSGLFFLILVMLSMAVHSQTDGGENASTGVSPVFPQLRKGIALYGEGKWQEAVAELRKAQSEVSSRRDIQSEAFFWIGLAELSAGEFQAAVNDMEALEKLDPANSRVTELLYHKGRAFYYLGRYSDAILLFKRYTDSIKGETTEDNAKKSAAYYWTGECLYSLRLFDEASEVFFIITEKYPGSVKFEAASYRIDLIRQKKIEAELLSLLKWSHEESLKTMEEYQRRERSYDQALIAYQKRIADMLKDTRLADLENANAQYQKLLASAEERIRVLEKRIWDDSGAGVSPADSSTRTDRLQELRNSAQDLESGLKNQPGGAR
ncbi:MAG: tetratricopeptide repeat protein [Treponematales bacterium]|jgi:tetratricopeptide (TPR) repeat protein